MKPLWKLGNLVKDEEKYNDPPQGADAGFINLIGWAKEHKCYFIYTIPKETSVADIIYFFNVGGKTEYHGEDSEVTKKLLCWITDSIANIVPFRVIFADWAGMKLRFERTLNIEDIKMIHDLFLKEKDHDLGLEIYYSEWKPGTHVLAPLLNDNVLHLWWD